MVKFYVMVGMWSVLCGGSEVLCDVRYVVKFYVMGVMW